ncbi:MAG: hypothetical protein ACRBB6_14950 [Neptuniibacter sp.]
MTDQTFNGSVDQVAGGNINNYGAVSYDSLPTEELYSSRSQYRTLLWQARKRLCFNMQLVYLATTVLGFSGFMLYSLNMGQLLEVVNQIPPWLFMVYAIFGVALPMLLVVKKRQKEGAFIRDCHINIQAIDIALNRRNNL